MNIWLRSNEIYDSIIKLSLDNGSIKKYSKKENTNDSLKINGWFSEIESKLFALYSLDKKLYFYYSGKTIELKEEIRIEVSGSPEKRHLEVFNENNLVFEILYNIKKNKIYNNDPTPFIEKEDFDFGLFVSNISKNIQRKKILVEQFN